MMEILSKFSGDKDLPEWFRFGNSLHGQKKSGSGKTEPDLTIL